MISVILQVILKSMGKIGDTQPQKYNVSTLGILSGIHWTLIQYQDVILPV